ncbi:MAG TPA: ABC transporter ATP-binding protein [Candidatus Omnitrophota bacterium]|nr:ABC transporter ATP-binding protein [Candidatus Omnitrophota bacterium]HPD85239.1 ABC transporter ATP-binding protein [Candidatus Omnitrophota bacterium]HRZ04260.1 ABC transporter ATP-binding protein [Candidatus Omnitrophota bacterium]
MIAIHNVSKYFATTPALRDVSFEVQKGELIGFLGPNGAGKTTLMRILTCYLPPTKGAVTIAGYDVVKESLLARRKIGYLPENPPLYSDMTVRGYLKFAAQIKDVDSRQLRGKIDKVLEECSLTNVQSQTIATLSKGYKQRVGLAQATVHDPEVLILDEPTNGLDPQQIQQVRESIKNLEHKRTVIVSTHILSEIELIVQRIIIIKQGQIAADKSLSELREIAPSLEEVFLKLTA